jgi:drug/metabolite transporter (DMT)-like permease
MHKVTGRWKLGLVLALITSVCWGVMPVTLKLALGGLDVYTITWYRFTVAAVVLTAILMCTGGLPSLRRIGRPIGFTLAIALIGLIGNYVFYLMSLQHTSPSTAQVGIQLGPMFFLLGGVVIFRERFLLSQWCGFTLLVLGLALFFNRRLPELLDISQGNGLGFVLVIVAAVSWAAYGLGQKQLLKHFKPQQILLLIYLGAIVLLLPVAKPHTLAGVTALQGWMLAFACANTLAGYGAFAEALSHWEVSRVGAVIATAPLFTLVAMWAVNRFAPGLLPAEGLNALSVIGALLVVGGSGICAFSAAAPTKERLDI